MVGETVRAKLVNLFDGSADKENKEPYHPKFTYQSTRFVSGGSSVDADRDWFLRGEDRSQSPPLAIYTDDDVVRKALGTSTLDQDTKSTPMTMSSVAHHRSRTSSSSCPPEGFQICPSSPEPIPSSSQARYSLDLTALKPSRFQKGTFNVEDLRSSSSSSWNFSSRKASKESHHEAPPETTEGKTEMDNQPESHPRVDVPYSTMRSGHSSYKTCNEGRLPPRTSLAHVFGHLSETSGASDTASIKVLRSRHPTDTNPLTDSTESLPHRFSDSDAHVAIQHVSGADGPAEGDAGSNQGMEEAESEKETRVPGRRSRLRPNSIRYFKRAREALHVRRIRLTQWFTHRFKHDEKRGRIVTRSRRSRVPRRSSSVDATHHRKKRQAKNAPLLRARSMFAIGSLENHSDSTISLYGDEIRAAAQRPARTSQSRERGRMSIQSLNKKLSHLSFSSTKTRRRPKTEQMPFEV